MFRKTAALIESALQTETDECILWPTPLANKYPRVRLNGKTVVVTRIICERAHGLPSSTDHEAAHGCGTPRCINKRHLRWATVEENKADQIAHGTSNHGVRNAAAKLTENEILEIRARRGTATCAALAEEYGISGAQVVKIQLRQSWAHIPEQTECDVCGQLEQGCVDTVAYGMDVHACPKCCGNAEDDDPGADRADWRFHQRRGE